MLRTTVVGSWPPADQFRHQLERYHRGTMAPAEADLLLQAAAATAIAQQKACGLDEYTGGETSADTFILHFARRLAGIVANDNTAAWDGRGAYRVEGELRAPTGLGLADAFSRERALDPGLRRVTVPGPSELTTMLEPQADRRAAWPAAIDLIRAEIDQLIALGATEIQLDLPQVAMGLADGGWDTAEAVDAVTTIFAGLVGVQRSIHLCYGDFGARSWARNRALRPLLATIQGLDGVVDRVVLELSLPEQWAERELLADLPASMELAAGIVDVKDPRVQSAQEVCLLAEQLMRVLPPDRLLLCPSCGLGRRTVEVALPKVEAMVSAARSL